MGKTLFDHLLGKQKAKTITILENKVLKYCLQADVLLRYFKIAVNYCKKSKIQKEVEELYPAWTGYENYYWHTYHYEAFGSALYSYIQAYENMLNLFEKKAIDFPQDGKTYLNDFLAYSPISKILRDRHDFVHQFGKWRAELFGELGTQDWESVEKKIATRLLKAYGLIKAFDTKMSDFINKQIQELN